MPKGLASVDAAKALMDYVQGNVPEESQLYPHVGLGVFEHSGMKMRGLSAAKYFKPDDTIISLPSEYGATMKDVSGLRFKGASTPKMALSLWLAEKKAELQPLGASIDQGATSSSSAHGFWSRAIANYPKLSHFESIGLPLAAPEKDLQLLDGLPVLSHIPYWVRQTRGQLAQAFAWYNENREGHPQLKWEDVLWGRIILSAYSFGTDSDECGTHLSPVADLIDHSMNNNAHFDCNESKHNIEIVADRPIEPGEELTIAYKRHPLSNFQFYGILDEPTGPLPAQPFTPEICSKLKNVHLESSRSPLAIGVSKLIALQCPGSGSVSSDTEVAQSTHASGRSRMSSWPNQEAEMDKMAEAQGTKMAEKELAAMPAAEVAKLITDVQQNPVSSLEASGLPFSEKEVAVAAMPPLFMLTPAVVRSRRADTAAFLDGPSVSSLQCQAAKSSGRPAQKATRSCSGAFQLYGTAKLLSRH